MLDVLLVVPPYYYKSKVLTSSVKEYAGLAFLAAVLRENGYKVEIFDADLEGADIDRTIEAVLEKKARVIGFTILQVAAFYAIDIIGQLRKAGVESHITIGGHFPTFAVDRIYEECRDIDSIVLGEGEFTLLELVNCLDKGTEWRGIEGIAYIKDDSIVVNAPRRLIKDLDILPFQSRDTLPEVIKRGGPAAIITSRGCYGNCHFCSVNAFYKTASGAKWRSRSPENVGEELEVLVREYGANIFVFNDDNFIGPGKTGKKRAYQIADEILKRKLDITFAIPAAVNDIDRDLFTHLKKAGLRSVFLGIESMTQSDLDFLNKHTTVEQNEAAMQKLDELGIFYQIGFIMFYPHSTLEEVEYTIEYVKDKIVKNPYCGTQVFTGDLRILHGTPFELQFRDKDFVREERFNFFYKIADSRVEQLRDLMDQLILKKTFPMMVDCKEDFMVSSLQRIVRTLICDLQLTVALKVIDYLKIGVITPGNIKSIIRDLDKGISAINERIAVSKEYEYVES